MKTTLRGKGSNSLHRYNLVHKFIPMPQAMKIQAAKAAVHKELEILEKIPTWNLTKVRNKADVIEEARKECTTVHIVSLMDIYHLKKFGVKTKTPKVQRSSCAPRWHCERRFRLVCNILRARIICVADDSSKSSGCHIKTTRMRKTDSWRSISLHPNRIWTMGHRRSYWRARLHWLWRVVFWTGTITSMIDSPDHSGAITEEKRVKRKERTK